MNKNKEQKRRKKVEVKRAFFGRQNTITLSIMFVILVTVSIVLLITYAYSQNSFKRIQRELLSDIFTSIQSVDTNLNNKNFEAIQSDLNNILVNKYIVKFVLVFDQDQNQIYSTMPIKYTFTQSGNNHSLKILEIPNVSNDNIKNIIPVHIKRNSYNVYLGINKAMISGASSLDVNTLKIFFCLIILVIMIISYMLAKSISKPLANMGRTISKISDGDLSGRLEYTSYHEINELVSSYNTMANTLQRMYSTMEKQVQDRTMELKSAYTELQNTQAMMVHSEKMKSLGELVAGIMHEINNPINFIYGNMTHLDNYSKDLIEIIETYTKHDDNLSEENKKEIQDLKNTIDYDFLKSDMPDLIRSCKEGADRAKNIIQDLKSFSRMEEVAITDVNIEHEIDTVLNILHNKIKNKAEVHKEFDPDIPKIEAYGGQLNQVFMNILDNAAGAIEKTGDIWIRIKKGGENLRIEIEDNGIGMDEETRMKVFNPFFTTKPVGQGTGLGMSITYKIIKNHQGNIEVESTKGKGSKFIITLPLKLDMEKVNSAMLDNEGI